MKKSGIIFALTLMGFTAIIAQVLLIRELLVSFSGNELSIGIFFANWLFLEALGSYVAGKIAAKIRSGLPFYVLLQVLISIFLPLIIYLTRTIKSSLGFVPGEDINFLTIFFISLFLLTPISLFGGAQFSIGCRLYSEWRHKNAVAIGKVYILEAIGSILGGLIATYVCLQFLNSFQTAYFLAGINIISASILLFIVHPIKHHYKSKFITNLKFTLLSLLLFGIITIIFNIPSFLNQKSIGVQWQDYEIVANKNSIYGNVALLKRLEQYSLMANGVPIATIPLPNVAFTEELVHIPLLYHPNPKQVLLIGGGTGGILQEMLQHPIEKIEYTELDPLIIKMIQQHIPDSIITELINTRVTTNFIDGRYFLSTIANTYDIIFINLPQPSTLKINRFYTLEFFRACKKVMTDEGILVFTLPGSASYMSHEIAALNANLIFTASHVFAHQNVIPDEYNIVLLSDSHDGFTDDTKVLCERLLKREIDTRLISESHLDYKLNTERTNWYWNEIRNAKSGRINSDLHPIALFYNLQLLNAKHSPKFAGIYSQIRHLNIWYIITGISVLFIALLIINRFFNILNKLHIVIPILSTGFISMGVTIVLILTFQSFYGYIYQWIGLIITAFMLGLTAGGLIITRLFEKTKLGDKLFIKIEALILFFCILLLSLLVIVSLMEALTFISSLIKIIILTLSAACGLLVGLQFPLANKLYLQEKDKITQTAGILYSSDLLGAWIGGLIVSIVFIPTLGILTTCIIFVIVKMCSLLLLYLIK